MDKIHPLHEELHKFMGITLLWTQSLEVNQQWRQCHLRWCP